MLILATSNMDKVKEIREYLSSNEVMLYSDIIKPFHIEEDGSSFKENAIIKAKAVYKALADDSVTVLADDSGISIDRLNGEPGIFSARYAGSEAKSEDNLNKVVNSLKDLGYNGSKAKYTCAMALVNKYATMSVHGYMYGGVSLPPRGSNGFGYDPIFVPDGYNKTLGELSSEIKENFSHRVKALELIKLLLGGKND